jgi:hypothetical protein
MKKEVGLWIDHRKTVMVTIEDDKEQTQEILSNVEKHVRYTGGKSANGPNLSSMSNAEDVSDRRYGNHMNSFYDGVVSLLRDAESIWIFGPGEAKVELKKRLEREDLGERIVSVETVDKMTNHQIAAKIREHYQS